MKPTLPQNKASTPTTRTRRRDPPLTDIGNARRLILRFGEGIRYCPNLGWLIWDSRRWARDGLGRIWELAKATILGLFDHASKLGDSQRAKRLRAWATRSQEFKHVSAMIKLAQTDHKVATSVEEFDRDTWLLNCRNGTVDLRTGKLRQHQPGDLITRLAGSNYDAAAICPLWDAFLNRTMAGKQPMVDYLARVAGYSMTGETREHCFFVLHGAGANGKSVLLETLRWVFGDYASNADISTFLTKRSDAVRNDVARLRGSRLVTAAEADAGQAFAEATVKKLTGSDTVTARFFYQEFFEFLPSFKLLLATNHRPAVQGTDHGFWRRVRLIPFLVTIPPDQQDRELVVKLRAEAPGILAWAVRGCLDWQMQGLREPREVMAATDDYRQEMDALGDFISSCCVLGPNMRASAQDLYVTYTRFATDDEAQLNHREFGLRLGERGLRKLKSNGRTVWLGIGIAAQQPTRPATASRAAREHGDHGDHLGKSPLGAGPPGKAVAGCAPRSPSSLTTQCFPTQEN